MIRQWFFYLLVTVLAGVLIAAGMVTGYDRDQDTELLLRSAGVVQRWLLRASSVDTSTVDLTKSPLVREAERYADLVKPLVKSPSTGVFAASSQRPIRQVNPPGPRPAAPSPTFTLLATSCYPSRPDKVRALVSEPGRGTRWVRCGQRLGYLVIEEIHNGCLVYGDGLKQHTLYVRPENQKAETAVTVVRGDH